MIATFSFDPRLLRTVETVNQSVLSGVGTFVQGPIAGPSEAFIVLQGNCGTDDAVARQAILTLEGVASGILHGHKSGSIGGATANQTVLATDPFLFIPPGYRIRADISALTAATSLTMRAILVRLRLPTPAHDIAEIRVFPDVGPSPSL